jgi:SecD/SecF fusion protein
MSRAIFDLLLHNGWLKRLSMMSFLKNPQFDFLSLRPLAIGGSLVLILISLGWAGMRGKDVLSIDFSGGTAVTFRVQGEQIPDIGSVRSVINDHALGSSRVGYKYGTAAEGRLLEVVLAERSTNEADLDFDALAASLNTSFDNTTFEHVQTNSIGGLIGARFRDKAILAALLASVAIVIYVSFRFEFAYGIASVVALLHDVIIAAGVYLLCGRQLSLPVVAALLTIMGYSLNDTIVVFDRIREDLGLLRHKTYAQIINLSINQTLSRTLLTSLTTLLVVIVLFLFGGGAINDFALVMLVGIVVGTYSSIFVASTVVATWHKPTREERTSAA